MKICKNCQYWRESNDLNFLQGWKLCSNLVSENGAKVVSEYDSCSAFYQRGKKAPLWMRLANLISGWVGYKLTIETKSLGFDKYGWEQVIIPDDAKITYTKELEEK